MPLDTEVRIRLRDADHGGRLVRVHGWLMVRVPLSKGVQLVPVFQKGAVVYVPESD